MTEHILQSDSNHWNLLSPALANDKSLGTSVEAQAWLSTSWDTKRTDNNDTMADHQQVWRRRSRTFRERKNILDIYDDAELIRRYRLDRGGIAFIAYLM